MDGYAAPSLGVNCTLDMNIIEEIRGHLKKHPSLSTKIEGNSISAWAENGFTAWAYDNGSSYTIGFDGWHEEFEDPLTALDCFAWGLSDECRLKIVSRNGMPHKWVVQNLQEGRWVNGSTTALIFFPFWYKAKITYKQNAGIDS